MVGLVNLARRYLMVTTTLAVGLLGIVLALAGAGAAVQWVFSGYALGVAAWHAVGMVRDILRGRWGLDILAVMAVVATVVVGEYVAALLVVLMLTGGEALESYANHRAKSELDALLTRAPQLAHRMDGRSIVDVRADEVRPGDVLLVRPSEVVPVDATLRSAQAAVDQSSLTGESVPVEKHTGDELMSGSVNGQTAIEVVAVATAADSQYQQIVELVAEAAASRAPVVRLADRYAVPFTLFSLALAGLASLGCQRRPGALRRGARARHPVPAAHRRARRVPRRHEPGRPQRRDREGRRCARAAGGDEDGRVRQDRNPHARLPGTGRDPDRERVHRRRAPRGAWHPPSSTPRTCSRRRSSPRHASAGCRCVEAQWAQEEATNGIGANIDGREVVVGKFAFVVSAAPAAVRTAIVPGLLAVYAAIDGRYAGALLASDRLRENAGATIERLDRLGVHRTMILTGDAQETADHVAGALGITEVRAECLPAAKVDAVRAIAERPVVMVGDGVNDAPALGGRRRRHRHGREGRDRGERVGRRGDPRRRRLPHRAGSRDRAGHACGSRCRASGSASS